MLKQVDDIYVLGTSLENLTERLEIVAREAEKNDCTFSISKFFAGRVSNIVSGHLVILDPSGKNPPKIGPDPARVEKLANMQPPKNLKEVRSFLGLVNQFSKFSPDYAMITTKIRTLTWKGTKFIWTSDHQAEFDKVKETLSDLNRLEPFNTDNELIALVDASLLGLGFVLFQKDSNGRTSLVQAGSTNLKHAQVRWSMPELELLAVKHMLNKCNFYTAHSTKPIIIYSDCSGLKHFQMRDISDIDNKRMATIKCDIMHYNYQIKHIPGQINCIADCLSRRPDWLVGKGNDSDSSQDLGEDGSRDELCIGS